MNEAKALVIRGNLVDIIGRNTYGAEITLKEGRIQKITPTGKDEGCFLLPGFIDAHIHIESSLVTPAAFINAAVCHGTIGVVADPYEITNVMGTDGTLFMQENTKGLPFYTSLGIPACVITAGTCTDHEASTLEEAREKCKLGMNIQIREGRTAKDLETLHPLLKEYPEQVMFCSDKIHPVALKEGHINAIVKKALELGYDLYDVLRAASYNVARQNTIPIGYLQEGDPADFIEIDNLQDLRIQRTFIQGEEVYNGTACTIPFKKPEACNRFHTKPVTLEKLLVKVKGKQMRVIVCQDGEQGTKTEIHPVHTLDGFVEADPGRDLLKLVVVNRYQTAPPAIGFIKGTGLKLGAIAQSVSHDSHNIIAVGVTDFELEQAINAVIRAKGGIAVSSMSETTLLPLPIAGLMSDMTLDETCRQYQAIEKKIKALHTPMESLQMTLSFMGLLASPSLKLSDKGLFDSENVTLTSLFV